MKRVAPRLHENELTTVRLIGYEKQLESPSVSILVRSVRGSVVAFPLLLSVAASIITWICGQVLVLAVLLGQGDLGADSSGQGLAFEYVLATAGVAAVAIGLGAAICARMLTLREVAIRAARGVALGQSAVLIALGLAHGLAGATLSAWVVAVFLAGAVTGAVVGALVGARGGQLDEAHGALRPD